MMAKPSTKGLVSGSGTVKVSLYGRLNQMVRYASTEEDSALQVLDNTHSGSRFGINASGSLNKNATVKATIEVGVNGPNRAGSDFDNSGAGPAIGTRRTSVSLTHKDMGTVSVGHDWIAGSGAMVASFAGTSHVFGIWGPDGDGIMKGKRIGAGSIRAFGTRKGRLLYRTPNLMGVSVEASYNQAKGWSAGASFSGFPAMKEVSIAVNAGYHSLDEDGDVTSMGVSGGVKHNASGFNVNGSWGNHDNGNATLVGWMVDGGWTGKLIDAGNTTLNVGYGVWQDGMYGENSRYHFIVNQNVAAAASDLYLGVSHDTGEYTHTSDGTSTDPCGATEGATCAVERNGVFLVVAGVLLKF